MVRCLLGHGRIEGRPGSRIAIVTMVQSCTVLEQVVIFLILTMVT